ncbi:hypothetical protein QAD02_011674 [Eretmocerus hayati]|uniref:Uncharacterized protein n=1 Tax=Eretmocerus hayati TaxID=131215 RepID=A0ACC2NYF5_9HYME|nr:hypothetical protein QAD02_011674 [Eretmocerus hayati]
MSGHESKTHKYYGLEIGRIIGISAGVDSAVATFFLKLKGFNIIGVFMKNWDQVNEHGECQTEQDFQDAKLVCEHLKIPLVDVNFVKDFWNEGVLLNGYEEGKTPIPDIECYKKVKFNKFFHFARSELGADAILTGHYARSSFGSYLEHYLSDQNVALLKARDPDKDQTFFLSQIPQDSLRRTMFPLEDYFKSDIRRIAKEASLFAVMDEKESMGICFIGKREFQDFIVEYIENNPGVFVDAETGKVVGKHNGIHQWTLGQCCRISGKLDRYFVFWKGVDNNFIYVVAESSNPVLFSGFLITEKFHWIREEPSQLKDGCILECDFRFQRILKPQRTVTLGQFAILYSGDECLGSAEITYPGPPLTFIGKEMFLTDSETMESCQS